MKSLSFSFITFTLLSINMVTTASRIKHTFIPRTRSSLFIKSGTISSSAFHPSSLEKVTEVFESTTSDSDESIDIKTLDKYELDDNEYEAHLSPLDKSIKLFVKITSSIYGFALACIILVVWIIIGAIYKAPDNWQIVMQDGQSIQSYIWDTLLMRQQLDDNNSFLVLYGRLKSRSTTHKRILENIHKDGFVLDVDEKYKDIENMTKLKSEDYFSKFSTAAGHVLGSLPAVIIYWAGVFVWVGCGALYYPSGNEPPFTGDHTGSNPKYSRFTDSWQMYINTSVAVVIMVTSILLGNVRLRSDRFVCAQIEQINVLDCKLESLGRNLTNDIIENELVEVPPCERRGFKKVISFYADIIGNGVGMLFSIAVFAAWIGIGHVMEWNSNWWLIIGTYTGLMGYIDGFVLREVYQSITEYEEKKFAELVADSQALLDISGINYQLKKPVLNQTLGYKISHFNNMVCSNQWSVIASIITVIALICIASGLKWSVTGQLICNTPTMIIEGFCLMILIQAHGWADYKRRFVVKQLAISRELLLKYYQSHEHDLEMASKC